MPFTSNPTGVGLETYMQDEQARCLVFGTQSAGGFQHEAPHNGTRALLSSVLGREHMAVPNRAFVRRLVREIDAVESIPQPVTVEPAPIDTAPEPSV